MSYCNYQSTTIVLLLYYNICNRLVLHVDTINHILKSLNIPINIDCINIHTLISYNIFSFMYNYC